MRLIESNLHSRRVVSGLAHADATALLVTLHDVLWPPDDPARQWSPDTLDRIAQALQAAVEAAEDREGAED